MAESAGHEFESRQAFELSSLLVCLNRGALVAEKDPPALFALHLKSLIADLRGLALEAKKDM